MTQPTYQWRLNGYAIPGATQSSYTRTNVQVADGGNYSVVVQNAAGSATSLNALLTVLAPQAVPPLSFTSLVMTTNGFKMHLSGPSGSNYVIYASPNLRNWNAIYTNSAPTGSLDYTDTIANRGARFYKATTQ